MLRFIYRQIFRDQRQEQALKDFHSRAEKGNRAERAALISMLARLKDWDNDGRLPNTGEVGVTHRQIE
jgi:hypothetical protein